MFGLALCLAALAALASGSGYITGREYVYRYHGYTYSGYPEMKHQYAAYSCVGDLIIQPHGDYAIFRLDNLALDRINQEVYDVHEYAYDYKPIVGSPLGEYMQKPFKVYRNNGMITQFQVDSQEPLFVVNLKRSIIALFHLNFDQSNPVLPVSDDELLKPDPNSHYYRSYEDGLLGECETTYVIEHHPYYLSPQNNIVLNVTKAKNYHNCLSTPNQVYSTFYGRQCGEKEYERPHTLHGNAYQHYHIRGDRHHYVIEHVNTEGEVAYTPYPPEGQTAQVYVNRTLDLVAEREVETAYDISDNVVTYTSLAYDFHHQHDFREAVDLRQPHYLYDVYGYKVPVEQIGDQLKDLVKVYDDETYATPARNTNYPAKFLELVRAASTHGYADIDQVYRTYAAGDSPEQRKIRKVFFDVLVAVGTNPAIMYAKSIIESRSIPPLAAAYIIGKIQYHVKEVTEALLDEIYNLCENAYVKEHLNLHTTCYLTLSNIVYDHCVAHYHPEGQFTPDKTTCPTEAAVKYFNYIANHLEESGENYLKVAYIKAAGNIGVKEAIRYLRPYVEGQGDHSEYHRSLAIWSLRHVAAQYPEKVRELVVPLYFNHSENYPLRLAAFTIFLSTGPPLYHLEAIARSLAHEEDDQVRSYVYSTFKSYENSTHPCDRKISHDIHHVLKILKHDHVEDYDYSFSHSHYCAGYDENYDYGGYTRFAYFASDTGYIPRSVYLGLNDYTGGLSYDSFGIGIKQYGLEKFMDKICGPTGAYGRRSVFDLFKRRAPRDVSGAEKELREIREKLNIATREYPPIEGEVFFKYMGNHISYFHFNETTFESFFTQGRFQIPDLPAIYRHLTEFVYQRFHLVVDKSYVIPTEGGMPLFFDYKQPVYIYHKNKDLKLEVEPNFFAEDRQNQPPTDVKVHFDGHIIADKNLYASMAVVVPFNKVTYGVGINRRSILSLPLKFDVDVHLRDPKVTAKWIPVAPHEIYHFHYEPYTFIDSYANAVPVQDEPTYLPVRHHHHYEYERDLFHDALGVGFHLKAEYDNEWNDYGSFYDFLLSKDFREKFYYLYANPHFEPYHLTVSFTPAQSDATTEVEAEFTYSYDFDQRNRPYESDLFTGSGFEEYSRAIPDRHYGTYIVKGEVTLKGSKERKAVAEIHYTRDYRRLYHKINAYYDRTPFLHNEIDHMKICFSGYMKYPVYDLKRIFMLDTFDVDHAVETGAKIHFGKDCTSDKKITVHGRFETSEEQRDLERNRDVPYTPERYNLYAYYYQKCQEDRQHGLSFSENCLEYFYLVTTLHKYSFDIKYEHLSPEFQNNTFKLFSFFRHSMYTHSDLNVYDVNNPENEIHVQANFSAHYPAMDLRVIKPKSVSHYTNVHVPMYTPKSSYPFSEDVFVISSYNDHYCYIEGDHVLTLDDATYTLPPIDCYKVIAKDCSPNENFLVLGTKITHSRYQKAVKVFLDGHKIEALPISDDSDIIIRIDGRRIPVTNDEPYFHIVPESKEPVFYITYRDFYYALHSKKYGLIVEYDGRAIDVMVSPYYRAKLCGLCGNYNGQKNDPYQSADGCEHYDTEAFAYSFAIPSDTCQVPEKKVPCLSDGKVGCTELRTHVVELTTGKQPQTCFSTEPVAQCSADCQPRGHVSRTLGFHCLPAKDDSTRYLVRQQQLRVLHEVRRKSKDHEAVVEVPEGCHRA